MSGRRGSVLVVDDTAANIDVLKNMLVAQQYQVRAAISGEIALKVARKDPPPDLILLDVVMPRMDGYEVCRQLKADPQTAGIPVVFVTGAASEPEIARGKQLGAADYLLKPLEVATVLAAVQRLLAGGARSGAADTGAA